MPAVMTSLLLHPAASAAAAAGGGGKPAPSYAAVLRDSIDRFLAQRGGGDLAAFRTVFLRLLHSSADPPLEVIWFYSAVTHHSAADPAGSLLDRVLAVKNLLQTLVACSASCAGAKCVALMAPALSQLHGLVSEASDRKSRKEIESLAESIVAYINICSSNGSGGGGCSDSSISCFLDLVRVWLRRGKDGGDGLEVFMPLVSEGVRERVRERGCDVEYLAGVVTAEAFLLRLCLKVVGSGKSRVELEKELRIWAVSSVTVFRNCAFFEILLRMLLDPTLPVMSLLNSEDENLVRGILYDVVVLVDYSFLDSAMESQFYDHMKNIVLTRLIVTYEAVRNARVKGDLNKAISYTNAFSTSCLPNGLIKLMGNQIGVKMVNRPNATTPQAFLKWLVDLDQVGMRLFEDTILGNRVKLIFDEVKAFSEDSKLESYSKKTDAELFFLDKQGKVDDEGGKDEEMEPMDGVFMSAARSMKSMTPNEGRKRKESQGEGAPVKFVKYMMDDSSGKRDPTHSVDDMNSESEADSTTSDEEMEETEH